jgi:hypothetical protein
LLASLCLDELSREGLLGPSLPVSGVGLKPLLHVAVSEELSSALPVENWKIFKYIGFMQYFLSLVTPIYSSILRYLR